MVPELPKRLFTGKEVAQVTGWTEGDMFTWMLHANILGCDAEHLADQHHQVITEVLYNALNVADQLQNKTIKADLTMCGEGLLGSAWLRNIAAIDDEREDLLRATTRVSLWLFGNAETGSEFIFPSLASALFTAHEIAAACAWDETVIADLWAISGETQTDAIPRVDGQQDETPEMCVVRMRREEAEDAKILLSLRSELKRKGLPYGDEACGLLLFSKEKLTKAAAKQRSVRLRKRHGID